MTFLLADYSVRHAGVDEVGRGALAGPVVTAAVVLDPLHPIAGIKDSKLLSATRREQLAKQIQDHALAVSIGQASVEEIDRLNILQATLLAMQRALNALTIEYDCVLVDGNRAPLCARPVHTVVGGDRLVPAIAAASIIAKVYRDRLMVKLSADWPQYGLAQHKGYGTVLHLESLKSHGACELHRTSFAPVKRYSDGNQSSIKRLAG